MAVLAFVLAACATDSIVPDTPRDAASLAIAPYEIHEECAQTAPGDRIEYRFASSTPVRFSLYYRDDISFVSPVSRADALEYSGIFRAPDARRYCLQWEAGRRGAIVDIRIRFTKGDASR